MARTRTQRQHDQFRNRLDMYCTLVFVSVFIASLAVFLTIGAPGVRAPFVLIAAGYIALAAVAYRAAIGSARGYCTFSNSCPNSTPRRKCALASARRLGPLGTASITCQAACGHFGGCGLP